MIMGEFSSKIMAELARDTGKNLDKATRGYKISQEETLGTFMNTTVPETAEALDQQFKDALFTLVLLRARNFMIAHDIDSREEAFQTATVSIELTLIPQDIVHNHQFVEGKKPHEYRYEDGEEKQSRGIIPKLKKHELDELEDHEITDFVAEFNTTYKLSCREPLEE